MLTRRRLFGALTVRLGVPKPLARRVVSAAVAAVTPLDTARRRRMAARLESPAAIPEADGFLRVTLPAQDVVARCRALFAERIASKADILADPKKRFLIPLVSGDEFNAYPDLLAFMLRAEFLHAASKYLGAVPVLAGAALWYSPTNDTEESSQRFHTDKEDSRQVKAFVAINDVDDSCGPFTFVPATRTANVLWNLGTKNIGRLDDSDVLPHAGALERMTGPAGSSLLVDTSRCLHYGSRRNTKDRLALMFHYLRTTAFKEPGNAFHASAEVRVMEWTAAQRLALG